MSKSERTVGNVPPVWRWLVNRGRTRAGAFWEATKCAMRRCWLWCIQENDEGGCIDTGGQEKMGLGVYNLWNIKINGEQQS